MATDKDIIIGSGKLYVLEFSGTIPANETIEVDANLFGSVSGGASISYKPKFYTAKDDLGLVSKTIITEEEATLKSGVCTLNGNTLAKISATARVTEAGGIRTVKIGGIGNDNGKQYIIRFVHKSGKYRVTIVGQNQAGFELKFEKEKETIVDAEFIAAPNDSEGTLIIFDETILGLSSLSFTLASATTGKTKISVVTPHLTSGNSYKYQIGASAISVALDAVCTTGWTALTLGTTEITATAGQVITLIEVVTADNKAKKYGTATVIDNIG